jgi:AmmeMemoRadiSam system protein A
MAPMRSPDTAATELAEKEQQCLLETAAQSIETGLATGSPLRIEAAHYAPALQGHRATFVTLQIKGALRGCIGSLEANRPLIEDVAQNAFAAAFRDPRFQPLAGAEYGLLDIHISVLSPPEPMTFSDEQDLLTQIRPRVDGLILQAAGRRGTFLPSVWESLPETHSFLRQLKRKTGLPEDYWSEDLRVWRYTTTSIPA